MLGKISVWSTPVAVGSKTSAYYVKTKRLYKSFKTIKQLIKGCIGGELAIDNPNEIASLSIFNMIPLGEERDTRKTTATKQSYFIPSEVEQFMTMLRMLTHVTGIIGSKTSAYYVKTKRLYKSFKTIKNQLKSLFVRHGESCGRYLCLLVHNLTYSLINDIMNDESPNDTHMQLNSLIEQVKVGIVITIPSFYKNEKQKSRNGNGNANHNNGNRRENQYHNNNNNNRNYNSNGNTSRNGSGNRNGQNRDNGNNRSHGIALYEFDRSKNYGEFFGGAAIRNHNPSIPEIGNVTICVRKLLNGRCNNQGCTFFHGQITNHDKIAAWITGNNLPLTKRE